MSAADERAQLISQAEADFESWPQYRGSWDEHRLAVITARVWRHGRTWFERGEHTIAKLQADGTVSAYSFTGMVDVELSGHKVTFL